MDPMTTAAIIGVGGDLLGGLFGSKSNEKAAKKQMEFQLAAMKNAHQWEVADLRAAGLNPILSAGGKGAAALPGASYQTDLSGIGTRAVSSALQAARNEADVRLLENQADLVGAQARGANFDNVTKRVDAELASAYGPVATSAGRKLVGNTADVVSSVGRAGKALGGLGATHGKLLLQNIRKMTSPAKAGVRNPYSGKVK